MDLSNFREPVSSLTHLSWSLLALPGTWLLWRRARGDRPRQLSLAIYGLSLALCLGCSAVYHGARTSPDGIALLKRIDQAGINMLISGSYTPLAWTAMAGRSRRITLIAIWAAAAANAIRYLLSPSVPPAQSVLVYALIALGGVHCYLMVARRLSHRVSKPLLVGLGIYAVGSLFSVTGKPVVWPGVFHGHDLFHVCVMVASLIHYRFMHHVVATMSQVRSDAAVPPLSTGGKGRLPRKPRPISSRPRVSAVPVARRAHDLSGTARQGR